MVQGFLPFWRPLTLANGNIGISLPLLQRGGAKHIPALQAVLELRAGKRIMSAGLFDFQTGTEPRRIRTAQCISIETGARADFPRSLAAISERDGGACIRVTRHNPYRR